MSTIVEEIVAAGHPDTATLMDEHLEAQRAIRRFDPTEIRLSEAAHCSRRQTLRILGYEAEPDALDQLSVFNSGHEHEERLADLWRARYPGDGNILREVEVASPFGTGHMDVWVVPIRHYVECKTTTKKALRYLPLEEHVAQVTLYLHYYILPTGGGTAEIAYRIKETGRVISYPVAYDPKLAERLFARLQAVKDAVEFGSPLPMERGLLLDRFPCGWEGDDGSLVTCPFWKHCWTADAEATTDAEATIRLLQEYKALDDAYRAADKTADAAKDRRERTRQALGKIMDAAGRGVVRAGGLEVIRSKASGWVYYDGRAAITAGVVSAEAMRPYERTREGNVTWTLRDLAAIKEKRKKGA